ncbi:hypothetical protein RRG08_031036 [Elysia crispata]|uniref:Uncharacterized protein n=1 Tax=Elysia crispata TaxID=231223 RepID=A0AAE1DF58_9GAST|nr:hypothetical protein RRG08_031036 [Elysia crispata]
MITIGSGWLQARLGATRTSQAKDNSPGLTMHSIIPRSVTGMTTTSYETFTDIAARVWILHSITAPSCIFRSGKCLGQSCNVLSYWFENISSSTNSLTVKDWRIPKYVFAVVTWRIETPPDSSAQRSKTTPNSGQEKTLILHRWSPGRLKHRQTLGTNALKPPPPRVVTWRIETPPDSSAQRSKTTPTSGQEKALILHRWSPGGLKHRQTLGTNALKPPPTRVVTWKIETPPDSWDQRSKTTPTSGQEKTLILHRWSPGGLKHRQTLRSNALKQPPPLVKRKLVYSTGGHVEEAAAFQFAPISLNTSVVYL